MLKNNIHAITAEISKYKDMSRAELYTKCVDEKLKATLSQYINVLNLTEQELRDKSSIRVLKAATKLQKQTDKEAILAQTKRSK